MDELHNKLMQKEGGYARWHKKSYYNLVHWVIAVVLCGAVVTMIIYRVKTGPTPNSLHGLSSFAARMAQSNTPGYLNKLTRDLLNLNHQFAIAPATQRDVILQQLISLAKQRRDLLLQTMNSNPALVMHNAIAANLRQQMPGEILNFVEQSELTLNGQLAWLHEDDFSHGKSKDNFLLNVNNTQYHLNLIGALPKAQSDNQISIKGAVQLDNYIAAHGRNVSVVPSNVLSATTYKKVGVILFNFTNNTAQPYTTDNARSTIFTGTSSSTSSSNSYYQENSFNKVGFTGNVRSDGDVYGWFTIAYTKPQNDTECRNNIYNWANAANAAAGISQNNYNMIVYGFPKTPSCLWDGLATIGGSPGLAWINDDSLNLAIVTHELGHNFGSMHANGLSCQNSSGATVAISGNCTTKIYNDPFSVMGGTAAGVRHFNNYEKGQNGAAGPDWLASTNTQTVTTSGDYTIVPIEQVATGVQSLRIPRTYSYTDNGNLNTIDGYYYLEFRRPYGYDSFATTDPVVNGVSVRLAPPYSDTKDSQLLDMTPWTSYFDDAPLIAGHTLQDSAGGITVATTSVSSTAATVHITFGQPTCTLQNPSITITPTTQNGHAGDTLSYSLILKNNDSTSCAAATFSVVPTLPSGWSQSPASFTETLNPGASISRTFLITSASNAAATNYTISQNAKNTQNSSFQTSISAIYNVIASSTTPPLPPANDTAAPTANITQPSNNSHVASRGQLSITATASDNIGVVKIEISFDNVVLQTCTGINLTRCSTSKSVKKISNDQHSIQARARDAASNLGTSPTITVTKP